MWGNLHGWLISAVLGGSILLFTAWLTEKNRMQSAHLFARDPANLAKLVLTMEPDEAWPIFTDAGDAGPLYRQAIEGWSDTAERTCAEFVKSPGDAPPLPLQPLVDARHLRGMDLFEAEPGSLVNYESDHARLENLFAAAEWAYKCGLSLHLHGQNDRGLVLLEAAFAVGRQLYRERLVFDEYQKGSQLMADAATSAVQTFPAESEDGRRLTAFVSGLQAYQRQHVYPIWQVIGSVDAAVIGNSAGDILAMAEHSGERMWRVEATLKLGRLRFDAGTVGDQLGARRALKRLSEDHDPLVAAAAKAATELTIERYRMIH